MSIQDANRNAVRNIKALMKEKGISKYRMCKMTGMNSNAVYYLINHSKTIPFNSLLKVCEVLGVTVTQMIEDDKPCGTEKKEILKFR